MISVELEYRPIAFIPWIRRIEKKFPSRWSEMTPAQITAIPDLQRGNINDAKLLYIFLGLKRSIAKRIDKYQVFCISRNLKYIREPEPLSNFLIKNILVFKAPGNKLKGVTFGAFIFGDTYYQNYIAGKKEDLNRFISCFYYNRLGFKEKNIEMNAQLIGLFDLPTREAIAINYGLIREWLAIQYPYVFQKTEQGRKDKSKGWVDVYDRLVQNDFGNQDKYAQFPVSTVLRHLDNLLMDRYKNGSQV